ncbi:MAG: LPS assembly lipoprotein LptE [Mesorhizobium sp.]|nr:LPS assembly lipoprotein LptE [Mesorhizobium sp.]
MSLPERRSRTSTPRAGLAFSLALVLLAGAGCTVRPLYSDAATTTGALAGPAERLSSVAVKPETTRHGLEVRNHLLFLLNGGAARTTTPTYTLELGVSSQNATTAVIQQTKDTEPTAGSIILTSTYRLTEIATGKSDAIGRRSISASFDVPRQEFAAMRAERDAQNRAARELAELLRHAVAQDLDRLPAG